MQNLSNIFRIYKWHPQLPVWWCDTTLAIWNEKTKKAFSEHNNSNIIHQRLYPGRYQAMPYPQPCTSQSDVCSRSWRLEGKPHIYDQSFYRPNHRRMEFLTSRVYQQVLEICLQFILSQVSTMTGGWSIMGLLPRQVYLGIHTVIMEFLQWCGPQPHTFRTVHKI